MARPLRLEFEGALYHVMSRGNAWQNIFLDDSDKEEFLSILSLGIRRYNWLCHAYCLMDNHYHLVIETPEGNLSAGMRQINGVYAQRFNKKHQRIGHFFQGRFKAILVEKDSYLLELCRYVVLNPVRAGLVAGPRQWKWSSYQATIGRVKVPDFLTVDWVLSQFGTRRAEATARFREFVNAGKKRKIWDDLRGQILLGSEEFMRRFSTLLKEKEQIAEIPRNQRYLTRPPLEKLFPPEMICKKRSRDRAASDAHLIYGYSMKEIADYLGVHYMTVSRAIARTEKDKML